MSDSKWIEIDDRTVCIMDKDLYFAIEENVSSLKARITQLEAQLAEPRNKCNCNCPSCSYCDNKLGGWTMSDEWSGFQTNLISITAKKMLRKMRDEYEARITELEAQLANQYQRIDRFVELVDQLEAQLAERWKPLPDGQYERPNWNHKGTNTLSVFANGAELETWHSDDKYQVDEISLPDNIRLCRLVTQEPTL